MQQRLTYTFAIASQRRKEAEDPLSRLRSLLTSAHIPLGGGSAGGTVLSSRGVCAAPSFVGYSAGSLGDIAKPFAIVRGAR